MAYIIQTRKRREKTVQTFLGSNGITSLISPAKEYVICLSEFEFPHRLKGHPQIVKVIQSSTEDAEKMLVIKMDAPAKLTEGSPVTLRGGTYDGFTGILHSINGEEATVHLTVFGKMIPATVQIDEIAASALPEIWR